MKKITFLFLFIALLSSTAKSQDESEDKTASPYFLVKGGSEGQQLPLISTKAKVDISGIIANVEIEQVYRNDGKATIEAEYVFPGSSKSAVHGLTMWIGERKIEAKIEEKKKAQEQYDKAKSEGKTASLLQQHRPNVFQMNIANILPKDQIKVILKYTEILSHEEGIYEFLYPTVVGPRYTNKEGVAKDPWVMNPHANPEAAKHSPPNNATFDIAVNLNSPVTIKEAFSPSHEVSINYKNQKEAAIRLLKKEKLEGNKDFILKYRLAGEQIEAGFNVYEDGAENFFMLMVQPPKRVLAKEIPPREYIFVVDVSGSMHGFPIEITKKLMKNLLSGLRPIDKFNILLFASGSSILAESSLPVTSASISEGISFVDKESGSGTTELLPALKRAVKLPGSEGVSRTIVMVTDGYITVEREAFDLIRETTGSANFFSFGIGSGVNRYLIEGMARVGGGEPLVITKENEAEQQAEKFRKYIESPVLAKIDLKFSGLNVYDVEPLKVTDLFAEKPIIIMGKYKGKPEGNVIISGLNGEGHYSKKYDLNAASSPANSSLKYLWARQVIMRLSDYNNLKEEESDREEIVKLGLKYNLLSKYTSFIGIDNQVRNNTEVNNSTASPGAVPEPHEWALIILASLVFLYFLYPIIRIKVRQL